MIGGLWLLAAGWLAMGGGCASNPQSRQTLDDGERALEAADQAATRLDFAAAAPQFDRAILAADKVVAAGIAADQAEAHFLHGRAIEDRPKPDSAAVAADLAAARHDYALALNEKPFKLLETRLHGQLGNVAYFQGDFATALQQWSVSYAQLENPQWKQWVLYRMGICQQRLGRFADADRTFAMVQDQYPGTEPAARAKAHQGVRGFYVQVGAFSQAADIAKAAAAVTAAGSIPQQAEEKGLTIVRTSGVPSYALAVALRSKLAAKYPDAQVMP